MRPKVNRTFLAWAVTSLSMFGLSFLWHNRIRDDFFDQFQGAIFSPLVYIGGMAIVYGVLGFIMVSIAYARFNNSRYDVPIISGPVMGLISGLVMFIAMIATGTFYQENMGLGQLCIGFVWQLFEQGLGGLLWGVVAHAETENQANFA